MPASVCVRGGPRRPGLRRRVRARLAWLQAGARAFPRAQLGGADAPGRSALCGGGGHGGVCMTPVRSVCCVRVVGVGWRPATPEC